jgi:adenylate cyclase
MTPIAPDLYADSLRREIMRSEQQRMRMVAVILAVLLAATTAGAYFLADLGRRLMQGGIPLWIPLAIMGPFILYEFGSLAVLRWRRARDLDFPLIARLANALIETSLPTVMVYVVGDRMMPQIALGGWPPLLYFIFILLSTLRLDFWLSVWTGAVAAVQQTVLAAWLLHFSPQAASIEETAEYQIGRALVLLLAGVVAGLVARSLRLQFENSVASAAARDRVTNLFGQHVSPAVVERLLAASAEMASETRTVCVMFLDIRGFTAMTRTRAAAETVAVLNDFFAEMVVNKFLGDGFLALFGAPIEDPDAAHDAVAAGEAMLGAVDRWNAVRPRQALRVGIGIHIGETVTGTVGSARRKEYTVIGDTVNLAARLEQLTKETGARLLVSDALGGIALARGGRDLGPMTIRGYDEKVRVWQLA